MSYYLSQNHMIQTTHQGYVWQKAICGVCGVCVILKEIYPGVASFWDYILPQATVSKILTEFGAAKPYLFLGLIMARVGLGLLSHLELTILLWSKTALLVDVHPLINKRQTNSNEYTHWPVNTIHRQQSYRWGSMQCHQLVNSLFIRLVAEILVLMLKKPQFPVPSVPLNTLPALQTIIPHALCKVLTSTY